MGVKLFADKGVWEAREMETKGCKDVWKQGQGPLKVRVLEADGTWGIRAFAE